MHAIFTAAEDGPLLPFLFAQLPEVKRIKVRQWLKYDGVSVNGVTVVRSDHPLTAGDIVELSPQAKAAPGPRLPAGMVIRYEDEAVIVIEKPANLLSIATDAGGESTAYTALNDYIRRDKRNRRARAWIVHRLDRETSGLMVFALTEAAKRTLQENWGLAQKRYFAVSDGAPPAESGTLRNDLDESNAFRVHIARRSESTREAVTHYRVVRRSARRTLFELTLETGRRHQIRVQLAGIECPIVGDPKYHSAGTDGKRMALHSCALSFPHPVSGTRLSFESSLPAELERMMGA
jgi:23S rRNA pseudouridine1911/1915/1917 synthase